MNLYQDQLKRIIGSDDRMDIINYLMGVGL